MEPETFGPPAPERLFTFRYVHPVYQQWQTVDTFAVTRDAAFARCVRYQRRVARAAARAGIRLPVPRHPSELRLEMPPCSG